MLGDFFFPGVVQFFFANAQYFFDGSVERGAVGATQFLPDVRNGFVTVVLDDVKYECKALRVGAKFCKERIFREITHVRERHEAVVQRCCTEKHVSVSVPTVETHA